MEQFTKLLVVKQALIYSDFCGEELSVEDCICEMNTKDVGQITLDEKPSECKSPNSDIIRITKEQDITQQLDPISKLNCTFLCIS